MSVPGVACSHNKLLYTWDQQGEIYSMTLNERCNLLGGLFPKGSIIFFNPPERIATVSIPRLPQESFIYQGMDFSSGGIIYFDDDGRLWLAILGGDQKFNGKDLLAGTKLYVDWHGRPDTYVTLKESRLIRGVLFPRGSFVIVDKEGRLVRARFGEETTLRGMTLPAGSSASFYFSSVYSIELSQPTEIQAVKCDVGTVQFDWTGKISLARLATDQEIAGERFKKGTLVSIDSNGKPRDAEKGD
jgi:hypothetical protein